MLKFVFLICQFRPLFVYFHYFLATITITQIEKSIDGVLGIQTRGRRMVGADKSTELWRPICLLHCPKLLTNVLSFAWSLPYLIRLEPNCRFFCKTFSTFLKWPKQSPNNLATFVINFVTKTFKNSPIWSHWSCFNFHIH